jgi:hypothetical protein
MRMRGVAAAVAGIVGAATAHVLDEMGTLPGVHEAAGVRGAMGPWLTLAWLATAGGLAWLAARTRPLVVGAPCALVVSAVPELVGRHDVGAFVEPGALAGAMVQWALMLAVIAVVVAVDRLPAAAALPALAATFFHRVAVADAAVVARVVDRRGRPRAPPAVLLSAHIS